jgi:putative hydrolase of HD superfamily
MLTDRTRTQRTLRAGWVRRGVPAPESVAAHSWRMALIAMLAPQGAGAVDRDRLVRMALVHDLAEAIVGDITPADGVPRDEKHRREAAALAQLEATLGAEGSPAVAELRALWDEYEAGASPEAAVMHDIDKIDMVVQALEYERAHGLELQEFFDSTAPTLRTPYFRDVFKDILRRRPADRLNSS